MLALNDPPDDVISQLVAAPPVELLDASAVSSGQRFVVVLVFGLVFLMFGMGGAAIAQSTVTEKQTRIVEILVSTVPVRALLAGKILGHVILTLGQVVVLALTCADRAASRRDSRSCWRWWRPRSAGSCRS